jgi:hypothetical protein
MVKPPSERWVRYQLENSPDLGLKRPELLDIYRQRARNKAHIKPYFDKFFLLFFMFKKITNKFLDLFIY